MHPRVKNSASVLVVVVAIALAVVTSAYSYQVQRQLDRVRSDFRQRSDDLAKALSNRADLVESFSVRSLALHDEQVSAFNELERRELALRRECSAPVYRSGVGILQVASVPERRGGDTVDFAQSQVRRLGMLLHGRNVAKIWSSSLSHYGGRGTEPIRRVVFHNIAPEAGAEMCAWLKCEKWTGGCAFIDERGETHTDTAPTEEFEPTVDLYESWKVAKLSGQPEPSRL